MERFKRRQDESVLANTQLLLRKTFDALQESVFIIDAKTVRIIDCNSAASEMFGYSCEEMLGQTTSFLHVDEAELQKFRNHLYLAVREKGHLHLPEFHMKRKNGDIFITDHSVMPLEDDHGECIGWVSVIRDITERKRTEDELVEKEGKYRSLFESSNDGIFIQDETGFFSDCNQKGAEMFGLTKGEIIGRSPAEFYPERQPDGRLLSEVTKEKMRSALSGIPQLFEWQALRTDGTLIDVEVTLSRVRLDDKMCLQAIVRDITDRKKLEQEMLKTQKIESIGTLAGGIAHDFNNLLQAMMGNISLAKSLTNPGEKVFSLLVEAEKASEQAKELSSRLLTFSKGGEPVRRVVSLENVLKESISLCLSGSNVASELRIPKDIEPVEADKNQMHQVFNNLLINAKEAMPDGGTVEISAANVRVTGGDNLPLKEGNYVKVSVADHGIGIPEKYLPRIFDPYFSTKDKRSEKGMGLGLAICYSIVAKHEGYIAVESRMGVGSSFHVYLPAAERREEEWPGRESHSVPGNGRVLFMDDDERVRRSTGAMLEQLGYGVEFAKNGEEAIERYRRAKEAGQTFDAVILDLTVQGGMGGEKAVRRLQEIDPEVRAVVSSGYADDPVIKNFGLYGFVDALAKPYNTEALKRLLVRLYR